MLITVTVEDNNLLLSGNSCYITVKLSVSAAAAGGQLAPAITSLVQSPFALPFGVANPQFAFQQHGGTFAQPGIICLIIN